MRLARAKSGFVCQEMVELVTAYLEDALSRRDRRRFEAQLAGCENCSEYLLQMRETIRVTGRLRTEDFSPAMREELTELFRRWRDDED
ncbi:MAG TPA: zf-HC2 domain-containing protein [Solirubrobacteraceae bacterium]